MSYVEQILPDDYKSRGGYTPAVKIDLGSTYMIMVSGLQAPQDNNNRVVTDDISEQVRMIYDQIIDILSPIGASLDDVVKSVVYLTDMDDFDKFSEVRNEYFKKRKPVSTLVEVNAMTRKGAKVEIEVTAIIRKEADS